MFERQILEAGRYYLYLLMLAGVGFGLVVSPPVLSIGLIGIVLLGLLDPDEGINPRWRKHIRAWLRAPLPWALMSLYLLLVLGVWQTEDWPYYLERLRIKIPLLLLPFAWPGLPKLIGRGREDIFGVFPLFVAAILLGVLVNYAINFEEVNALVQTGRAVPVPRNHIRFSLLVAVGVFLALRAYELRDYGWSKVWLGLAVFLFAGLHLLAVRSGLVGAYGGLLAYALVTALKSGRWWPAAATALGLLLLPVLAYLTVPSFTTKMDYARYELFHRDRSVDDNEYSDEGRLASITVGLEIWRDHPLLGVGPGNLLRETDRRYAERYPGREGKRPHNQFVSALAGSGLLGGVITVGAFLLTGYLGLRARAPVYTAVWALIVLSCLVENTLENTVGASMTPLLLLLLWESRPPPATPYPSPGPPPSPPALSGSAA